MNKKIKLIGATLLIVTGGLTVLMTDKVKRLSYATSLFSGKEQYENFAKVPDMFPVTTLKPADTPHEWKSSSLETLPESYVHLGTARQTANFLSETDTSAMIVIKDGQIRYENYWLTGGRNTSWPSWSVAKSYVSALIGIAIEEGLIKSVQDPITDYLPELNGSGYDGVSIKDILQMSSGARWNEDYSDFKSDINRLGRIIALGGSLDKFSTQIGPDLPPGTYNRYNSADTQVLGRLIVAVSGFSLSEYMDQKLWKPLGAESNGHWLVDNKGMEMAFAGFNATARDYAKLGQLYLNKGKWNGKQIIPNDWVNASVTPDAPHLMPGDNPASNNDFGYGYQWWVLDGDEGEYTAMGVYNQFIYINPARNIVIVKLSANSQFGVTDDQESYRDQETISLLRQIARTYTVDTDTQK